MVTDAYLSSTPASESDAIFITVSDASVSVATRPCRIHKERTGGTLLLPKMLPFRGTVYVNFVVDATGEVETSN